MHKVGEFMFKANIQNPTKCIHVSGPHNEIRFDSES